MTTGVDQRRERCLDALADALIDESRQLQRLQRILEHQRRGVAENDATAIETSIRGMSRTLMMVEETRRRRALLMGLMDGRGGVQHVGDLDRVLGDGVPDRLVEARQVLQDLAAALRRELEVNQQVIDSALQVEDTFLQRVFSGTADLAGPVESG